MLRDTVATKKRLALVAGFMVLFLVVLNFTTFTLYRRAKAHLDNQLGARLGAVASGLAHAIEATEPDSLSESSLGARLLTMLHLSATEYDLSNVVVLTLEGLTVFDLQEFSKPGEPNPFIDLDFSAVTLARSGIPAYTNLYKSGDVYMKSAYAPILSGEDEVIGILGVEAGASFFDELRELTRAIALLIGISMVAVVAIGWVFYRQTVALDRAQAAVIRKENLATIGRMVASIAHDIRNPLSIINASAERLRKKYGVDDEIFSYISDEVDQLNRVITGYLDFAGDHTGRFEPLSAQRLVRRCIDVLDPEVEAKSIQLEQELPAEDFEFYGDDKRLQQALMNVVLNAVQAVPGGGRIRVSLERDGSRGLIMVSDDGPGIAEKDLKEVTKPFYTSKADGSGLGLSIVKTVVEEHGGDLEIQSHPGRGTSVRLSLPLAGRPTQN